MIAGRQTMRERRTEVLHYLSGLTGRGAKFWSPGRGRGPDERKRAAAEPLRRALVELGPVFAAFGIYLSSRGDLLAPADRKCLAGIGRDVSPLPASVVRAIVRAEGGRSKAGMADAASGESIATVEEQPFDTRLLIQRHYGRLSNGAPVVVRVVHPLASAGPDLRLLPLLREVFSPFVADARLFVQALDDFSMSFESEVNGLTLADSLEFLGREAQRIDWLSIPKVYRATSTPRVLLLERMPGQRLSASHAEARPRTRQEHAEAEADAEHSRVEHAASHDHVRMLCELWLWLAFDGGLVSTGPRPEDVIVMGRSRVAIDEGAFAVLPNETRRNLLRYLVAIAIDEPCKALDCLLREFEGGRHRTPLDQLDRLFRQMVPDPTLDEPTDGPAGRLAATMQAHWRLVIDNGYRPLRHALPLLRGVVRVSETAGVLAPGRDAILEGLKDYRITQLLGDVHAMFEPMYWLSRLDRIATLMVSSPRVLDDALSAVTPDRAAEERRAPIRRDRPARGALWLMPTLAALAAVGLGRVAGCGPVRAPPGDRGMWAEAPAAALFLLLSLWVITSLTNGDR